jgi:CheY-like chemotaxis protein
MDAHRPDLTSRDAIRALFQRACEGGELVRVTSEGAQGEARVLAERPEGLLLAPIRGSVGAPKPGRSLGLHPQDRGLPFEGAARLLGLTPFGEGDAWRVEHPSRLRALDTHRLVTLVPDRPATCPFVDAAEHIRDGLALGFGPAGLELAPPRAARAWEAWLGPQATTLLDLRPVVGERLVLPLRVTYLGDRLWGLAIEPSADPRDLARYHAWLEEALGAQAQRDAARFSPEGVESARVALAATPPPPPAPPRVLVDRDPMILVMAEGDIFPCRLASAVGRRFGVATLEPRRGPLRPLLGPLGDGGTGWGRVRLVLLHHRLRRGLALARCEELVRVEGCPLPVLISAGEEALDLRRARARAAGAADCLVVEPFRVLHLLRALDQALSAP